MAEIDTLNAFPEGQTNDWQLEIEVDDTLEKSEQIFLKNNREVSGFKFSGLPIPDKVDNRIFGLQPGQRD